MNNAGFLSKVKIASPCNAGWAEMDGDDRARFCALCQKHVYNLSVMTAEEVVTLIREKEGRFCGRYYQRADGTMLTADCPVGLNRWREQLRFMLGAAAAAFMLIAASVANVRMRQELQLESQPRSRLALEVDKRVAQMKAWLYAKPTPPAPAPVPWTGMMLMGDICIPTPVTKTTNSTSQTTNGCEEN